MKRFPLSEKTRNLVRFCRHPGHQTLHESFAADFGFRAERSRFSVLKNYGTQPGPDECFTHLRLDARPLFEKLLGLEFEYPDAPIEITRQFSLYHSLNYYRSHIEEIFTHSGNQTRRLPPVEGQCTTFFPETDALVIAYALHNASRADVEVKARWTSRPSPGIRHEATVTDQGFTFGCEQHCQGDYWARASLAAGEPTLRFEWNGEHFESNWLERTIPAGGTVEWTFRVDFAAADESPARRLTPAQPARALTASIGRIEKCYANLPALRGEFRRFEPLVLKAAGMLLSNRYLERDRRGRPVATIHAGKCGVESTWWWDTATHLLGLGLMGETTTAHGAVRLLLDGLGPDGRPFCRYNNGQYWGEAQMPVLAWGVSHLDALCPDRAFLRNCYGGLRRYVTWWLAHSDRNHNGLVEYPPGGVCLDDALRWMEHFPIAPEPGEKWFARPWGKMRIDQFESPDVNAHLYLELRALARISRRLGRRDDSTRWNRLAVALAARINQELFDRRKGVYQDRHIGDGRFTDYITLGGFIPLYAGIAPRAVAQRMCRRWLLDPNHFYTHLPFPSVDRSHPAFRSGGALYRPPQHPGSLVQQAYWCGRTWIHYSYWMVGALWQSGLRREADAAAFQVLDAVGRNESLYECYDPLTATGNGHAEFSWGAAPVMALACRLYRNGPLGKGGGR